MASGVKLIKGKRKYAQEVAKIKSLEVFGVDTCGVTWNALLRKHLAFDVLGCGGPTNCDGQLCLWNEISKTCNCS
jgi:hypothetical protein